MNLNHIQLADAARRLRIPVPSDEIIKAILHAEGTMLVRAVGEALKGDRRSQAYLQGVLMACHESTQKRLAEGRLTVPSITTLVAIGKAEGPTFGLQAREWAEAGHKDGDQARYLRLTLARHLEASRQQAQATPAPREPMAHAAPTAVRMPHALSYRPNRDAPASAPASVSQAPSRNDTSAVTGGDDRQDEPLASRYEDHHVAHPDQREEPAVHRGAEEPQDGEQQYLSQHIYGGRAAACFSADKTRGGVFTVRLEAAEASAQRQYNWKNKIAIQLSQRELPLVLAVFMQYLPKFEGKGHGENNSKWFTIERQQGKLFLSVSAKGQQSRAVPIMPGDGYAVTTLLMRQMLKNDPFLSSEVLLGLVRKEAQLLAEAAQAPIAGRAAAA